MKNRSIHQGMHNAIPAAIIASSVIVAAVTMTGCTAAGYFVGGALDGGPRRIADSVSVELRADSAGNELRSLNMDRLRSLAARAGRGRDPVITVLSGEGAISGESITIDTVLAVEGDSLYGGREELLPGDSVTVALRDSPATPAAGNVVSLSQRTIVVWTGNFDRAYPLRTVTSLTLADGRVLSGADLASPDSGVRFVRVTGLTLDQAFLPRFIPLRTVERVTVARSVNRLGPARLTCMAIGAGFDIAIIVELVEDAFHLEHDGQTFGHHPN